MLVEGVKISWLDAEIFSAIPSASSLPVKSGNNSSSWTHRERALPVWKMVLVGEFYFLLPSSWDTRTRPLPGFSNREPLNAAYFLFYWCPSATMKARNPAQARQRKRAKVWVWGGCKLATSWALSLEQEVLHCVCAHQMSLRRQLQLQLNPRDIAGWRSRPTEREKGKVSYQSS